MSVTPRLCPVFVGLALTLCLLPASLAAQSGAAKALAARYATRFGCDTASTLEATRHPDTDEPPGMGQGTCWVLASLGVPRREQRVEVEGLESLYWYYLGPDGRPLLVVLSRPEPAYGFAVSATSW